MKITLFISGIFLINLGTAFAQTTPNTCNIPSPSSPIVIGKPNPDPLAGPIIYDLDNDGITLRNHSDGVMFDIDNDGILEQTGWTDGKDGFLVLDTNCNNIIDNQLEMFGSIQSPNYRRLYQYDANKDYLVNAKDPIWPYLQIWVDTNVNGKTEKGELKSIEILKSEGLNLAYSPYQYINKKQPHETRENINNFFINIIQNIAAFFKGE